MNSAISLVRLCLTVSVMRHDLGVRTPHVHAEVSREEEPRADRHRDANHSQTVGLKPSHLGA